MIFNRNNRDIFSNWWWTIDRLTFFAILGLVAIGMVMVVTASPVIAESRGYDGYYFVRRQFAVLGAVAAIIFGISLLSPVAIRRLAVVGFAIGIVALLAVLGFGSEIKGAKRWIYIFGQSIQPSEFIKPFFTVLTAWLLSRSVQQKSPHSYSLAIGLYGLLVVLLILQPDFGMVVNISLVWGGQLFLAGLPMVWVLGLTLLAIMGVVSAYNFLPHVAKRINSFFDTGQESYQVQKSMDAFANGGLFGQGPGEGKVKQHLPDAHTDFIFAVAGEELGLFVCVIIVALFATIVLRSLLVARKEKDVFILYAIAGLGMQFGVQSLINMGVTLNLIPNTGMTLPFISYGGSSLVAIALAIGMLLALTRKRYGNLTSASLRRKAMVM